MNAPVPFSPSSSGGPASSAEGRRSFAGDMPQEIDPAPRAALRHWIVLIILVLILIAIAVAVFALRS
jgi:hypothetical protein